MTDRVGVTTTIVGWAASDGRNPAYDKEGTKGVKEVSIANNEGYTKDGEFVQTGTTWYTISAGGDYADQIAAIKKGDKIKVENAKQEVREYKDREGNDKLGITLRYGTITVLESKSGGAAPAAAVAKSDDVW